MRPNDFVTFATEYTRLRLSVFPYAQVQVDCLDLGEDSERLCIRVTESFACLTAVGGGVVSFNGLGRHGHTTITYRPPHEVHKHAVVTLTIEETSLTEEALRKFDTTTQADIMIAYILERVQHIYNDGPAGRALCMKLCAL